jgi:hypothetical protein
MNERHRRDELRIDLSDAEAVRAWTHKLGVSPEELALIVDNVGNHTDNVFEHLLLRR